MTNEEKIEKMLKFFHGSRTLKDLLLEMAEWKDEQFQEEKRLLIEKAVKWLDDNQRTYREYDESGFYHERSQHLIKDFKQAMEE